MGRVEIGVWDLRHLLLSLEDGPRCDRDGEDLEGVVRRAVEQLCDVPPRPPITAPPAWTAPMLVQALPLWIFETNSWVLAPDGPGGDCLIIDVPPSPAALVEHIGELGLRPVAVVLTHAHVDHVGGVASFLKTLAAVLPVYLHPWDNGHVLHPERDGVFARVAPGISPPPLSALRPFENDQAITVGSVTVRAAHTPGHTAGSTCVLVEGGGRPLLFTGDTLFAGGSGRCDLPGGSRPQAEASLRSLLASLSNDTVVLPGHGGITTVGRERAGHLGGQRVA